MGKLASMIYSVANPDYSYTYYEGPGAFSPTGMYRKPRGKPTKGLFPPEQCLPVLPLDAVRMGTGNQPRGTLAVRSSSALGELSPAVRHFGVGGMIGFFVGWLLSRRK